MGIIRMTYRERDGVLILALDEPALFDDATVLNKRREIDEIVQQHDAHALVLDFAQVNLMGSAALGMLIRLKARFAEQGRRLALGRLQPPVREVMRITQLDRIFDIYETLDEAVAALHRQE